MFTLEVLLEKAIKLAELHHFGQKDKGGNPYILHVKHVMNQLETLDEKIVGVLHDIVEDTTITLEDLRKEGFWEIHIEAIDSLTRRKGESYDEFLYRVLLNPLAAKVKKQDILHNSDITRLPEAERDTFTLVGNRYKRALEIMEGVGKTWFYGPTVSSRGRCSWFKLVATAKPDEDLYTI